MTTIADIEVLVEMDTRQVERGFDTVNRKTEEMARRHDTSLMSMRRSWMQLMATVGAFAGFTYSVEKMSGQYDKLQETMELISEQIGARLKPSVQELNRQLDAFQKSDWPARIGDGLTMILELLMEIPRLISIGLLAFEKLAVEYSLYAESIGDAIRIGPTAAFQELDAAIKAYEKDWDVRISKPLAEQAMASERFKEAMKGLLEGHAEPWIATPKPAATTAPASTKSGPTRSFTPYDLMMQAQLSPESRAWALELANGVMSPQQRKFMSYPSKHLTYEMLIQKVKGSILKKREKRIITRGRVKLLQPLTLT